MALPASGDIYVSGEYAARNPGWHLEHSDWKARQVLQMLQKHHIEPRLICEVGCGAGGILEALRNRLGSEPQCVGYDVSPQAIELAREKQCDGVRFRLGTPAAEDGPFDLVMAMDVLEHVEDYLGFIRNLKPLAPWTVLHIPLDLSAVSLMRPMYLQMAREHVGHLHYFTLETALASVRHGGFEVKDWFYTSVELEQGTHGRKRLQTLRRWLFRWKPAWAVRWLGGFSVLVLAGHEAPGNAGHAL